MLVWECIIAKKSESITRWESSAKVRVKMVKYPKLTISFLWQLTSYYYLDASIINRLQNNRNLHP